MAKPYQPTQEDVWRVIEAARPEFTQKKLVLVGGQALAFWAHQYRACPELQQIGPLASKDIDLTGGKELARRIAERIGGDCYVQRDFDDIHTAIVLVKPDGVPVDPTDDDSQKIKIDFLLVPIGVGATHKEFLEQSMNVRWGKHHVVIMHPYHVLRSRITNLNVLDTHQGEHSQAQCRASIYCMREFTREWSHREPRRALKLIKRLKSYLLGHDAPRHVWQKFGIDARDAILEPIAEMPENYRSTGHPATMRQLEEKWRNWAPTSRPA